MKLIDADAHVIESEQTWKHLAPDFYSRRPIAMVAPEDTNLHDYNTFWLIDRKVRHFGATPIPGSVKARGKPLSPGCQELTDMPARLAAMDARNVEKQVVHPSFCTTVLTEDPELEVELLKSYNTFMAERCAQANGRLFFNAVVSFRRPDAGIEEIRRVKRLGGMVSVLARGIQWDKPLDHPDHYPIYEECERQNLPVVVHLGAYCPMLSDMFDGQPQPQGKYKTFYPPRSRRLLSTLVVQYGFYSLVEGYLIDDFPRLRWAFLEGGGSEWVVGAMSAIGRAGSKNCRRYFDEGRIFLGCEPDDDLVWVAQKTGDGALLAASDMPHTDEASHDDVVAEFEKRALSPQFLEAVVRKNALRLFDFDQASAPQAAKPRVALGAA
jgi:predicted TIM-barrel fold metal-dependent hydrolase